MVALVAVAFGGITLACPTVASAHAAPVGAATCDEITGDTLAQNSRWRIVRAKIQPEEVVVACRRNRQAPAKVRELSSVQTDTYNPMPVTVDALAGNRAVVREFLGNSQSGSGTVELVDLASGGSARIANTNGGPAEPKNDLAEATLAPSGGLVSATWTDVIGARPEVTAGPLAIWNSVGPSTTPFSASQLAASRGDGATPSGVYYRSADGALGRVSVPTPRTGDAVTPDPSFGWQTIRSLRRTRFASEAVALPPFAGVVKAGGLRLVEPAKGRSIRVKYGSGALDVARLAPGTASAFRVLAISGAGALAVGRFSDRPGQRRLRFLAFGPGQVSIDLPATQALERPGSVALGVGNVAIAQGDQVTTYNAQFGSSTTDVPGAHDLALPEGYSVGAFVTDATETVRSVPFRSNSAGA